jgi:hypothetical protein
VASKSSTRTKGRPASDLIPNDRGLALAVGAGEQDAGLGTGWRHPDPPLRAAIVRQ